MVFAPSKGEADEDSESKRERVKGFIYTFP
jgi:hypothetical protein